jgi:hypothetical protein
MEPLRTIRFSKLEEIYVGSDLPMGASISPTRDGNLMVYNTRGEALGYIDLAEQVLIPFTEDENDRNSGGIEEGS